MGNGQWAFVPCTYSCALCLVPCACSYAFSFLFFRPFFGFPREFVCISTADDLSWFGAVAGSYYASEFSFGLSRDMRDDALHFRLGYERSLDATWLRHLSGEKEHVAASEKLLSTSHVKNSARIYLGCHLKRHARGDIRLDKPGDDFHARTLGGKDEMDAHGAAHLGEAHDSRFKLARIGGHYIGELVYNEDDVGHGFGQRFLALSVFSSRGLDGGCHDIGMVGGDVTNLFSFKDTVSAFHFLPEPLHREYRFLRVGDYRREKMGDGVVGRQLDSLRVDHNKA